MRGRNLAKKPGEGYRTLALPDAVRRLNANGKWPSSLASAQAGIVLNIEHLAEFRNNSVHFYNAPGLSVVVHSLAQQSIINFRDFLQVVFGKELTATGLARRPWPDPGRK